MWLFFLAAVLFSSTPRLSVILQDANHYVAVNDAPLPDGPVRLVERFSDLGRLLSSYICTGVGHIKSCVPAAHEPPRPKQDVGFPDGGQVAQIDRDAYNIFYDDQTDEFILEPRFRPPHQQAPSRPLLRKLIIALLVIVAVVLALGAAAVITTRLIKPHRAHALQDFPRNEITELLAARHPDSKL
jgi:hypothetical protein